MEHVLNFRTHHKNFHSLFYTTSIPKVYFKLKFLRATNSNNKYKLSVRKNFPFLLTCTINYIGQPSNARLLATKAKIIYEPRLEGTYLIQKISKILDTMMSHKGEKNEKPISCSAAFQKNNLKDKKDGSWVPEEFLQKICTHKLFGGIAFQTIEFLCM